MAVECWTGGDFRHPHERLAAAKIIRNFRKHFEKPDETVFLVFNAFAAGNEMDLLILKRNAVIVVDLKECAEPFVATDNGDWVISTGGKLHGNPFRQVRDYRYAFMSYLSEQRTKFLRSQKASQTSFEHVSAIVAISPSLHPNHKNAIPDNYKAWFHLTGVDELHKLVANLSSQKFSFHLEELHALVKDILHCDGYPEQLPPEVVQSALPTAEIVTGATNGRLHSEMQPYNIPPKDPFFTGRHNYLETIRSTLSASGSDPTDHVYTITGLPGVGKTQLAIQYAHHYRSTYAAAFWINAETFSSIQSGCKSIASLLNLTCIQSGEMQIIMHAVLEWMETHEGWLLILDNLDDFRAAIPFCQLANHGHCLITTRLPITYGLSVNRLELAVFGPDEGTLYLLRRSKLLRPDASHYNVPDALKADATTLVNELGGLPLALNQAGAFMEETHATFGEYLTYYREEGPLLRAREGEFGGHTSVAITFALAISRAASRNPAAAEIVRFSSFLPPVSVPEEIFTEHAETFGGHLANIAGHRAAILDALTTSARFGLISRNTDSHTLAIHRVVQEVCKDEMDRSMRRASVEHLIDVLNLSFPYPHFENWSQCERYVQSVLHVAPIVTSYDISTRTAARLLNRCGTYLFERAQFATAESLMIQGLALREKLLEEEDPDIASSLRGLAAVYVNQNRHSRAKPLLERALSINQRVLGPEHLSTGHMLYALGDLYMDWYYYSLSTSHSAVPQNALMLAEEFLNRALIIQEQALSSDNIIVAYTLRNFGKLYWGQKKLSEASAFCRRALAIHEKVHGVEHPLTADVLSLIGSIESDRRNFAEAELYHRRAIEVYEMTLGAEHPKVGTALKRFSALLLDSGRHEEAEVVKDRRRAILAAANPNRSEVRMLKETIATAPFDDVIKEILINTLEESMDSEELNYGDLLAALDDAIETLDKMSKAESQ